MDLVLREQSFCLLIADTSVNDNIITLVPINWGGNTILITQLDGVDHTDDLVLRTGYIRYEYE